MGTTTPNMGLTKPSLTDTADITVLDGDMDITDAHDHTSGKGVAVGRIAAGLLSARPAAGHAGACYFATDTNEAYFDNGSAWEAAALAPITAAELAAGACTGAALGSDVMVLTGAQTVTGQKTLTSPIFTGTAGGAQTIPGAMIQNGGIGNAQMGAAAVAAANLANGALIGQIVLLTSQEKSPFAPTVDGATHTVDVDVTTLGVPAGAHVVYAAMVAKSNAVGGVIAATMQGLATFVPYLIGPIAVANFDCYAIGWVPVNTANNKITYSYNFPVGQTVSDAALYIVGYIL